MSADGMRRVAAATHHRPCDVSPSPEHDMGQATLEDSATGERRLAGE